MRSTLVALTLVALAQAQPPSTDPQPQGSQLIVLVRHAEKAPAPPDDVPLSDAGRERARALSEALATTALDAIVTTHYRRTRETAGPVAAAARLTPVVIRAGDDAAAHGRQVAASVRRGGASVLVVGHSNTVPAIIAALGGPAIGEICEAEYANLFVLALAAGQDPRLVRASYGQADPPGAGACRSQPARP